MFASFHLQLAFSQHPDRRTHAAGDARIHADALRHVLQRLDLPWGHPGLRLGILCGFSSPETRLRCWNRKYTTALNACGLQFESDCF